ncbi:MAG TPA: POTRA domain-containing protein [Chitinophagales bacterium]|nr:POTRA domain-containing protein [Chitinophagales bacterium]HRK26859.1 POTRA domain-containing protein [Chitinophagales bacterium]
MCCNSAISSGLLLLFAWCLLSFTLLHAQTDEPTPNLVLVVKHIAIQGNKLTKNAIIFREMDIAPGDTLVAAAIEATLQRNRNQIYNSRLFNDVTIQITAQQEQLIELTVTVEERWYILPAPIFELADRNFNEWWVTHKRSLQRTEYGFLFVHENFRGRRELLKTLVQLGFTKKIELSYVVPFVDKQRKTGINPFISYITNREIQYITLNNKQQFYRDEEQIMRMRFKAGIGFTRRPNIRTNHYLNFTYFYNTVADTIKALNPNYFLNGKTRQQYLHARYEFWEDHRDIAAYPLNGYFFGFQVAKSGFGVKDDVNLLTLSARYSRYFPLAKKFYALAHARAKVSFPQQQPYFNQEGLGFGSNYLRGYEYYIVDGQHFALLRTALRYQAVKLKIINPLFKKLTQFRTIPFAAYLKVYGETGYVTDRYYYPYNPLANSWLASGGIGIDLYSFYDKVFSIEYSINRHDQKGGIYFNFNYTYE